MPGNFPRWPASSLSHLSTLFCFSCLSSLSFAFSSADLLLDFSSAVPSLAGVGFSLMGLMWEKNQHTASFFFKTRAGEVGGGGLLTVPHSQPCPPGQSPPRLSPWRQAWYIVTFGSVGARQRRWGTFLVVVRGAAAERGRERDGGSCNEGSCQYIRMPGSRKEQRPLLGPQPKAGVVIMCIVQPSLA